MLPFSLVYKLEMIKDKSALIIMHLQKLLIMRHIRILLFPSNLTKSIVL